MTKKQQKKPNQRKKVIKTNQRKRNVPKPIIKVRMSTTMKKKSKQIKVIMIMKILNQNKINQEKIS